MPAAARSHRASRRPLDAREDEPVLLTLEEEREIKERIAETDEAIRTGTAITWEQLERQIRAR